VSIQTILIGGIVCAAVLGTALPAAAKLSVVPKPVKVKLTRTTFVLDGDTGIRYEEGARETAEYLASVLRPATGLALPVASGAEEVPANTICLVLIDDAEALGAEGYRLVVENTRIEIAAPSAAGLFYGVQTLRQLLPTEIFSASPVKKAKWKIPGGTIEDYPRFAWRGMMLDVARYFMPKEFVKKFIDSIALHKMNRLQLHLTDDQGWRIEIKKYPKLTEVGAWRAESIVGHGRDKPWSFDGKPHGGFYTQDDIRELVAYAESRHVMLIPEIEMPGHAQSAIAAYPQLGNLGKELPVWTGWGVNEMIFNPKDETIRFLQDVLEEVVALFPSPYIHIGGDEAVKNQWQASEAVQARIKALGLDDEDAMQSYFIAQINEFLKAKGRRLIGWDEILDGGRLSPEAVVMSWHGDKKSVIAARAGHDVVLAPPTYTYFDYYQGDKETEPLAIGGNLPLERAYNFPPLPKGLAKKDAGHILGAQGQVWTEYIPTPEHAEYMAFPRACALAEAVWTPQEERDYDDFRERLDSHLQRMDQLGIAYRKLD
jgi:hexosaminidase